MLPTSSIPGRFLISRGTRADYAQLQRFHYRPRRPATFAAVWRLRFHAPNDKPRLVAVAVVSWPTLASAARERELGIAHWPPRRKWAFVTRHVRTISRVIVHPQFRAVGLASRLVRWICAHHTTHYTEAFARMGLAHPFFEKAGLRKIPQPPGRPVYYLYTRPDARPPRGIGFQPMALSSPAAAHVRPAQTKGLFRGIGFQPMNSEHRLEADATKILQVA